MNNDDKTGLKRLERLFRIRHTYVSIAEAGIKRAEGEVRRLETAAAEVTGNIDSMQAGFAYLQTATGHDLQRKEKYIHALQQQRKLILQSLEQATGNLEQQRREWTEAMREQRIIEKMQERRLLRWERDDNVAEQKTQDDVSVGRHVWKRLNH